MSWPIEILQFEAESAIKLADSLRRLSPAEGNGAFLILWGPPGDRSQEIETLLKEISPNVNVIGCSANELMVRGHYLKKSNSDGPWSAVFVTSPRISPFVSSVQFSEDTKLDESINKFIFGYPREVQRQFFTSGAPPHLLGKTRDGVRYRRPAVLITILPGMGDGTGKNWPSNNRDYEIIECLAGKISWSLGVCGGTAVADWSNSGETWLHQWMLCRRSGQREAQVIRNGIVGLLFETDLNFGIASEHGLTPTGKEFNAKQTKDGTPIDSDTTKLAGYPTRFHQIALSLDNDISVLTPPTGRNVDPLDPQEQFVFVYNSDIYEQLPNPPYRLPGANRTSNRYQFLRPVSAGTTFFAATANSESYILASRLAVQNAITYGEVGHPMLLLTFDCRGRHFVLGNRGVKEVTEDLNKHWPHQAVGFAADGETSSTLRRIPLHKNWTFSTLVLGGDFSRRYLSAAEKHLVAQLDLSIAKGRDEEEIYRDIVRLASGSGCILCCSGNRARR